MSQISSMNDSELHQKVKSLAAEERHLIGLVLEHIAEVDRRKLYIPMAYSSLFDYLTREIGYSAGSAQRRIDAARLMHNIPEVLTDVESGAIHLGQISKLQRACRQIKKDSSMPVQTSVQKEILSQLKHKSNEETDFILAKELNIKVENNDKTRIQRDESTRVEITFSKEEMALIRKAQDLLSHKTGGGLKETLVEMAKKVVKASEPRDQKPRGLAIDSDANRSTATVAVTQNTDPIGAGKVWNNA